MEMIDRVEKLVNGGKSNKLIARMLGLEESRVIAYKANITRRKRNAETENVSKRLERYMTSNYIVIPSSRVERLDQEYTRNFAEILDILLGKRNNGNGNDLEIKVEEAGIDYVLDPLPESEVREIVIELKKAGVQNADVYKDQRLKRVKRTSITSYLAHANPERGTYKRRGLL